MRHRAAILGHPKAAMQVVQRGQRRLISHSGVVFGIALGGFLDGILLHSILQWHHMISNVIPPTDMHGMIVNMLADGYFDAFCWTVTIAGIVLLYREASRAPLPSPRAYLGWMLVGAGSFNFIEGIVDHEILRIHHVRPVPSWLWWDLAFLAGPGILCFVVGWILSREQNRAGAVRQVRAA